MTEKKNVLGRILLPLQTKNTIITNKLMSLKIFNGVLLSLANDLLLFNHSLLLFSHVRLFVMRMDCSSPAFHVLLYLPEFAQTHFKSSSCGHSKSEAGLSYAAIGMK